MAYTPKLSMDDSTALRRIAWGLELPMTKALSKVISLAVRRNDYHKICVACKDQSKCSICRFKEGNDEAIRKD